MSWLPLAAFDPIDLDELLTEAELLTRVDRKYVLNRRDAWLAVRQLDPRTRVLEIDQRRSFAYESVYFDTPELLSYRQTALARRHRFKVRTRSYLDSDEAFLEVKTRAGLATVKDRVGYDIANRTRLTEAGRDYAGDTLEDRGLDPAVADDLDPTLVTRYERITLVPPVPGVRVTVDTDLSWEDADGHTLHLPDLVILETKSGTQPSEVDRLLWRAGHRPATLSKYATGLAALRSDLPANRWARVLRRHFTTTKESSCAA